MKYKNIVFDFGNVIGKFDGRYMLEQFCSSKKDCDLLYPLIYANWADLDRGLDYEKNARRITSLVPERLRDTVQRFFRCWPEHMVLMQDTLDFIDELHGKNIPVYLLSNASTYFAEWPAWKDILKDFSGVVFSGPLKMVKPEPGIYRYLFETYSLDPKECFFVDDLEENIEGGRALGMDGIIFTGSTDEIKAAIDF